MNENNINRRDMIRISSIAALSNMVPPALASAAGPLTKMNGFNVDKRDSDSEICFMSAVNMAALLRAKKISAREVMEAHLKQIAKVNAKVNAIITFVPEDELMAQALAADESLAKGNATGPMHGLPMTVKDLIETKGIRTTYGSPLFKDFIPTHDALVVERQKKSRRDHYGQNKCSGAGIGVTNF